MVLQLMWESRSPPTLDTREPVTRLHTGIAILRRKAHLSKDSILLFEAKIEGMRAIKFAWIAEWRTIYLKSGQRPF